MSDLEQIKKDYLKAKIIIHQISDADDHSMEAQIRRMVWDTESLEKLRQLVDDWNDHGIHLIVTKN